MPRRPPAPRTAEATKARDRLSTESWKTVNQSGKTQRGFRALVSEVGPDSAIEHTEVRELMLLIESTSHEISAKMRGWRAWESDERVLQALAQMMLLHRLGSDTVVEHIEKA